MNSNDESLYNLIEIIKRKAPEFIDLMAAKTDDEFESAFDALLFKAVHHLEQNKKNYMDLEEEGLTGVLAAFLSIPCLRVTQEQNSNGHVDIIIEAEHCNPPKIKLGEAKIYHGPEYHISGLKQLLERYTTGRETRGMVLAYIKKKNISDLMGKIREKMNKELPQLQKGAVIDHLIKWAFISTHEHSCGDHLQVSHIGFNLYIDD